MIEERNKGLELITCCYYNDGGMISEEKCQTAVDNMVTW